MTFVQIIDCRTDRVDEFNRLLDDWTERTRGRRTATHAVIGSDRADSRHLVEIVEFPSREEALRNSRLPETDRVFRQIAALCDEPPGFTDLDVIRDEQLHKETARRYFEALNRADLGAVEELLADGHRDHDQAHTVDAVGSFGMPGEVSGTHEAFDFAFAVESQIAEGDEVATRWSWRGRHVGEILGLPATHKVVEMTGTTTFRFRDGRIADSWWNWDSFALLRQLGLVRL